MRRKVIAGIIKRKIAEWLESIEDESVRELAAQNVIVTGGSIASMLLDEKVRDYDLYFTDHGTTLAVAAYYVNQFCENPPPRFKDSNKQVKISVQDNDGRISIKVKSAGVASAKGDVDYQYFESEERPGDESSAYLERVTGVLKDAIDGDQKEKKEKPYRPIFLTQNAITLTGGVQLVTRFYGSPEEVHKNFDFVHCFNYWTPEEGLVLKAEALEALLARELRYVGSLYPICSIFRTRKFINRGWTINAGQYLKMCWQVNELELDNLSVLEDQLTGVDTAYFMELIAAVKADKDKDPNLRVDNTYIAQLVDKLF